MRKMEAEVKALAIQLGTDQISSKYFLASMTQHANAMNNLQWQVSGGKSQQNPSLKELARSMEEKLKSCNKRIEELRHYQSIIYRPITMGIICT